MTGPRPTSNRSCLVVGVEAHQPDGVVLEAIRFARTIGADLVLAAVDEMRYPAYTNPDGTVVAFPLDPDGADDITEAVDAALATHLESLLEGSGVGWSVRALAGEPAHELAKLADEIGAIAIVVGTHRRGLRTSTREFFNGSVAVHLAHRQHHPVIVIPLDPLPPEQNLPWEDS